MVRKYYLKTTWMLEKIEVTRNQWIQAERTAGFHPNNMDINNPKYMKTGFTGGGVTGSIGYV